MSDLKTMKTLTVELEVRKDGGVGTSFQDDELEASSWLERFPKGKVHEYVMAGID